MEAGLLVKKYERMRVKEGCMYVEAEYFVFESFVQDFFKSFGDVTKDYVCGVFVLSLVGYGFM